MDGSDIAAHFLIASGDEPPRRSCPALLRVVCVTPSRWSRRSAGGRGRPRSRYAGSATTSSTATCGRAASLGADVDPSVVVSAFGVFAANCWRPSTGTPAPSRPASRFSRPAPPASAGLRAAAVDVAETDISDAGDLLIDAVHAVEPGSRPLFAALQSLPVPDDPFGRLWRGAELVREHRGDTLAACAVGLETPEMNVFTEVWLGYAVGGYSSTRGFDAEALALGVSAR